LTEVGVCTVGYIAMHGPRSRCQLETTIQSLSLKKDLARRKSELAPGTVGHPRSHLQPHKCRYARHRYSWETLESSQNSDRRRRVLRQERRLRSTAQVLTSTSIALLGLNSLSAQCSVFVVHDTQHHSTLAKA